jgi:hypothetical protein
MVTVHVSNVLSPATFITLPLNGTGISATVDAGICAALHRNLKIPFSPLSPDVQASEIEDGKEGMETSNRLGRAPPPASFDLN